MPAALPAAHPRIAGLIDRIQARGGATFVAACGHLVPGPRNLQAPCAPCADDEAARRATVTFAGSPAPAPVAEPCTTCDAQRLDSMAAAGAPHRPRTDGHAPHCGCNRCWRD